MLDAATILPAALGIFCVLIALRWRRLVGLVGDVRASLLALRLRRRRPSYSWDLPIPARVAISRRRPIVADSSYADPRGVMNLRPLRSDRGGMWLDVDRDYLGQVELKSAHLRSPSLRPGVFAVHPPLARDARGDGVLFGSTGVGVARSSGERSLGGFEKATAPNWELENACVTP